MSEAGGNTLGHPPQGDPLRTPLTELTGVRWPVVQTGMGWVAGPRLVVAVAEAGGLGILASSTMTLAELKRAVAEVKDRTGHPFGVNVRADAPDAQERIDLIISQRVKVASFGVAPPGPGGPERERLPQAQRRELAVDDRRGPRGARP